MNTDSINIDQLKQQLEEFATQRQWQQYHNPKNLSMALSVESAELLEIFQWLTFEEAMAIKNDEERKSRVGEELADIILYAVRLASVLEINVQSAVTNKIGLNRKKYPA